MYVFGVLHCCSRPVSMLNLFPHDPEMARFYRTPSSVFSESAPSASSFLISLALAVAFSNSPFSTKPSMLIPMKSHTCCICSLTLFCLASLVEAFLYFRWGVANWATVFWRGNLGLLLHCLNQLCLERCIITFPWPTSIIKLTSQNKAILCHCVEVSLIEVIGVAKVEVVCTCRRWYRSISTVLSLLVMFTKSSGSSGRRKFSESSSP